MLGHRFSAVPTLPLTRWRRARSPKTTCPWSTLSTAGDAPTVSGTTTRFELSCLRSEDKICTPGILRRAGPLPGVGRSGDGSRPGLAPVAIDRRGDGDGERPDPQLVRSRHSLPSHWRGVPCRVGSAEPAHFSLHRRLRAHAHPGRHAGDEDRHEEDAAARAAGARTRRDHVGAVLQLHRTRTIPGSQRYRRVGIRGHGNRGHGRLVPRQTGHARAWRHGRGRLQCGGRGCPSTSGCMCSALPVGIRQ